MGQDKPAKAKVAARPTEGKPTRRSAPGVDWLRLFWMALGVAFFAVFYFLPDLPDAVDPQGKHWALSHEGKLAIGLFLFAATWWVFEVIPIGVTAIAIAVLQSVFLIREPRVALTDFMDPSVWFIFGSVIIGLVFSKTGLTNRLAYGMLAVVGERTSLIYLGSFVVTAMLTLVMAHTAVAAAVFPLLMAIYSLYEQDTKPTRFGAGLFIGMAFTAGAGSIITLLGAARSAVAIGFYRELAGREITFFELTWYMLPVGVLMVLVLWLYILVVFPPEKDRIEGLEARARKLYASLGPMKYKEFLALGLTLGTILLMGSQAFFPALREINKSSIILGATVLFYVFGVLRRDDLQQIPWNIVLLFGGAMSLGFCLWQTGAANWMAISWLSYFQEASPLTLVLAVSLLVMIMTNIIMNVAAIAIALPVALTMSPYLGVASEAILFGSLVAAGMPFLFLVGAAPNAIAYQSKQFTTGQFFLAGVPASILLMLVIGLFAWKVWPAMGMPV